MSDEALDQARDTIDKFARLSERAQWQGLGPTDTDRLHIAIAVTQQRIADALDILCTEALIGNDIAKNTLRAHQDTIRAVEDIR